MQSLEASGAVRIYTVVVKRQRVNYATCFDPIRAIIRLYTQWYQSRYRRYCHLRDPVVYSL